MTIVSKHKQGDVRQDGKIFWHYYRRRCVIRELWLTKEKYDSYLLKSKSNAAKRTERRRLRTGIIRIRGIRKPIDRERNNALGKIWRKNNAQRCRENKQNWRNKHRELVRKQNREWLRNHPEKRLHYRNNRRALEATGVKSKNDPLVRGLYKIRNRVSKCMGIRWDVDHIIPLKHGGAHALTNMQIIPTKWNQRKGAKLNFTIPIGAAAHEVKAY